MTKPSPWGDKSHQEAPTQEVPTQEVPTMDSFQRFYERDLKVELFALEQARPAKLKAFYLITAAAVMAGLTAALILLTMTQVERQFLILIGVIVFGAGFWAYRPLSKLQQDAKIRTMTSLCRFLGLNYRLQPQNISLARLGELDLIPSYNEKKLEDQITGDVRGVDFDLFEAKLIVKTRDSKGRTKRRTVFRGLLCEFDFHKNFHGTTIISKDHTKFGNFFAKFGKIGERIKLEDPEFEKMFEVYGTDQVESRYLLTPAFMERTRRLNHMVGSGNLQLAFDKGRLLLAIKKPANSFEGGTAFSNLTDITRIEKTIKELTLIYDVVDKLRLELETRV
ncbi:Possible Galanin [hydrothermal vent metagenome]|uniref:Possible Galanin n=1 Tax=hydrothermal vent metagenome TaxID=652676 RepID=A0A3B1AZV3_9ZZZZ